VGEIEESVGLDDMAVAAGDDGLGGDFSESDDGAVFAPAAHAVQLEGVQARSEAREEFGNGRAMRLLANPPLIPQRMVENDENARRVSPRGQNLSQMAPARVAAKGVHFLKRRAGLGRR
jgi:hypothetical protein